MDIWDELYKKAKEKLNPRVISPFIEAGGVAAAILTDKGNIYTGVCIDTSCTLGMCAERNAIANMITNGESKIVKLVCVMGDGSVGSPCGACREYLMQLDRESPLMEILVDHKEKKTITLEQLIPDWWGKGQMNANLPPIKRIIKSMEAKYLCPSLDLVEDVFAKWDSPEEGRTVRQLVEEIRVKKYYIPELELIMTDEEDAVIGYAMFSRFHLEGKYEDQLLLLTPVAVKTELQRQHISKDLIEYGVSKAKELGFQAVLVEGNPKNYNPRGFKTSADFGITASPAIHLPHVSCLMVKELAKGALENIHGVVDYSFYDALRSAGE